ncbi:DUF5753 domain-containing protein [Streptomyces albipurpureus]|uniref:DUF5753 domain-containing protein n=1 Tax=Streptomyces albipurpureus TaxID=2897419 RepID=A0ABT0UZN1_9ACTN|nr:DUF5753 domain-containing protein [Streptomyces sp. CWNU-1]MCM2393115.1 DUF5753 domain-containing protein [Streptomyces sp. CWNU-1]
MQAEEEVTTGHPAMGDGVRGELGDDVRRVFGHLIRQAPGAQPLGDESAGEAGAARSEEYARALLETRRPALSCDELERAVAARMARRSMLDRSPAPELSFVQEEVTLRRPIGGRMVLRQQLEHLLGVARLRSVEIQVMPTARGDHPGTGGRIQMLKFEDGTAVGRTDDELGGRPVSDPRQLRILELRYGIIRARALSPGESLAFIEQVLGDT